MKILDSAQVGYFQLLFSSLNRRVSLTDLSALWFAMCRGGGMGGRVSSQQFMKLGIDWLFTSCVLLGHFTSLSPHFIICPKGIKLRASSWHSYEV